jgi:hypothetical protein
MRRALAYAAISSASSYPDRAQRNSDRDAPQVAAVERAQERSDQLGIRRPAEGQCACHRCARTRTRRDQEHTIGELGSSSGARDVGDRVDGDDLSRREARSERQHLAEAERLSDRERPVPEPRVGSDQLDVHALPGGCP